MQDKSLNSIIWNNQKELLGKNKSYFDANLPAITASREIQIERAQGGNEDTELPNISAAKFDYIVIEKGLFRD